MALSPLSRLKLAIDRDLVPWDRIKISLSAMRTANLCASIRTATPFAFAALPDPGANIIATVIAYRTAQLRDQFVGWEVVGALFDGMARLLADTIPVIGALATVTNRRNRITSTWAEIENFFQAIAANPNEHVDDAFFTRGGATQYVHDLEFVESVIADDVVVQQVVAAFTLDEAVLLRARNE